MRGVALVLAPPIRGIERRLGKKVQPEQHHTSRRGVLALKRKL